MIIFNTTLFLEPTVQRKYTRGYQWMINYGKLRLVPPCHVRDQVFNEKKVKKLNPSRDSAFGGKAMRDADTHPTQ